MNFPLKLNLFIFSLLFIACSSDSETDESVSPTDDEPVPSETYFPPASRATAEWETVSLAALGWDQDQVAPSIYYLEDTNTDAFIILKDGRIVMEEYFGDFQQDDNHAWNSAGKNLTSMLTGIAQQEDFLTITEATSQYLGNGWTKMSAAQEGAITIENQLTMTTGLDYTVNDFFCTDPDCLDYYK